MFNASASSGFATFIGTMPGTTKSATYYIVPTASGVGYTSTPTADQKFATEGVVRWTYRKTVITDLERLQDIAESPTRDRAD